MSQINKNNDPLHLDRVAIMNSNRIYNFIGLENKNLNVRVSKLQHSNDKILLESYIKGDMKNKIIVVKKTLPSIKKALYNIVKIHGGLKNV